MPLHCTREVYHNITAIFFYKCYDVYEFFSKNVPHLRNFVSPGTKPKVAGLVVKGEVSNINGTCAVEDSMWVPVNCTVVVYQ